MVRSTVPPFVDMPTLEGSMFKRFHESEAKLAVPSRSKRNSWVREPHITWKFWTLVYLHVSAYTFRIFSIVVDYNTCCHGFIHHRVRNLMCQTEPSPFLSCLDLAHVSLGETKGRSQKRKDYTDIDSWI